MNRAFRNNATAETRARRPVTAVAADLPRPVVALLVVLVLLITVTGSGNF